MQGRIGEKDGRSGSEDCTEDCTENYRTVVIRVQVQCKITSEVLLLWTIINSGSRAKGNPVDISTGVQLNGRDQQIPNTQAESSKTNRGAG